MSLDLLIVVSETRFLIVPFCLNLLGRTLGNNFSAETQAIISNTPDNLQAALILGSPEMMKK